MGDRGSVAHRSGGGGGAERGAEPPAPRSRREGRSGRLLRSTEPRPWWPSRGRAAFRAGDFGGSNVRRKLDRLVAEAVPDHLVDPQGVPAIGREQVHDQHMDSGLEKLDRRSREGPNGMAAICSKAVNTWSVSIHESRQRRAPPIGLEREGGVWDRPRVSEPEKCVGVVGPTRAVWPCAGAASCH